MSLQIIARSVVVGRVSRKDGLRTRGFRVLAPRQVPANDGGLSLGQAVIAAARWLDSGEASPCA